MGTDLIKGNGHGTLLERLGAKYLPDTPKAEVLNILQQTAFKTGKDQPPATPAQVASLLVVADQYGLNPWTKEIFAFPDKQNGIVPVVGVDGWNRIANEHPQFDGEELELPSRDEWVRIDEDAKLAPPWMRILIYRKDRAHPTDHTEYLDECYRPAFTGNGKSGPYKKAGPWQSHTKRMLEHKTRIQGRRIAFGFSGIYDQDEAERIVDSDYTYEATAVEVETLGADAWATLVESAGEMGFSADDVLATAATLGYEGPGGEMPREVAKQIYRGLKSASEARNEQASPATETAPQRDDTPLDDGGAADAFSGPTEEEEDDVPGRGPLGAVDDPNRKATNAEKKRLSDALGALDDVGAVKTFRARYGGRSNSDLTKAEIDEFTAWAREQAVGA